MAVAPTARRRALDQLLESLYPSFNSIDVDQATLLHSPAHSATELCTQRRGVEEVQNGSGLETNPLIMVTLDEALALADGAMPHQRWSVVQRNDIDLVRAQGTSGLADEA